MKLKDLIDLADKHYPDGLIRQWHTEPDGDCGDTLAKFIEAELRETFDEDLTTLEQLECAAGNLECAIEELTGVHAAIEAEADGLRAIARREKDGSESRSGRDY